jgi:Ca2+-binding EF-hand superfamily protein
MASPIITALDANQNGVIEADELAKAAEALKTLDKNHDGKLDAEEYRPQMPGGPGGPNGPGGRPPQGR